MIANHFITHGGGVERVADDLARYFAERPGYAVTLAAHGTPPIALYETLKLRAPRTLEKVSGLPLLLTHPADLVKLRAAVRSTDLLVLHDNLYVANLCAQKFAHESSVPVLLIKHTGWVLSEPQFVSWLQRAANKLILGPSLQQADCVVAVTQAKRLTLEKQFMHCPIQLIENGIDTDFWKPDDTSRDVDVLFVGRFIRKKGIALVEKLAKLMPDLTFACAGFGPEDPRHWHLPNCITVVSPSMDMLRALYRRSKVTIVPCFSEGTPLVVYESLACGTPVLTSREAAHPKLEQPSLPIDLEWPKDVVMRWGISVRSELARVPNSKMLSALIESDFSLQAMGREYEDIVDQILGGVNAGGGISVSL